MLQKIFKAVKKLFRADVRVKAFQDGDRYLVRSSGLSDMNLPEIEISDCPMRLKDVASNLILQVARNSREKPESIADGKTIGARFVQPDQSLVEAFRLVKFTADSSVLRIVDLQDNFGSFPYRLVATHLCTAAAAFRRDQLRLLLVSVEVWPMEKAASTAVLGDYEFNPNNFWSWIDLGTVLSQMAQTADAVVQWKIAVCMWPRGGKLYARRMVARDSQSSPISNSSDSIQDFWQSVANDSIRKWCAELNVELSEIALQD